MTLYRKSDIKNFFVAIDFKNPSDLEGKWAGQANYAQHGLKESKIVNTPLNIVQKLNINNRHGSIYTTKDLLDKFNSGLKIDINEYNKINNIAPHAAIVPKFITR